MKKYLLLPFMAVIMLASACEKLTEEGDCNNLPHNAAPAGLTGGWANGFTTFTQIIDVYNGKVLGSTWQSGKYFRFTPDGKGAEFYIMAKGQYSATATKVNGTIEFDEGSTEMSGSFMFHACSARYRGWGSMTVDRDATEDELKNNLSRRYFYRMEGNWLRIEPGAEPNAFTSSFRKIN